MDKEMLTREEILSRISSYDILSNYLAPFTEGKKLTNGKLINSPLRKENHPSFNIYLKQGETERDGWRFKDFAGEGGDCFQFVQELFKITFKEALQKISNDFNLRSGDSILPVSQEAAVVKQSIIGSDYKIITRSFTQKELEYWQQFNIRPDILERFNVVSVESFTAKKKDGSPYTFRSTKSNFIFAYPHNNGAKLYKPLDKEFRFQHVGTKPANYIFGFNQLPNNADLLFITGGEKDVLTLTAQRYNAIAFSSETANLETSTIVNLKKRFKNIIVLYDNDETGLKQSEKISAQHNLVKLTLPKMAIGKDVSDYFKAGLLLADFHSMVLQTLQCVKADDDEYRKMSCLNALELLALDSSIQRYLIKHLLPATGTAVLVGKPDTGKSQLARLLAVSVCLGCNTFLGFELYTKHQRALFIATEDDQYNTRYLLEKQLQGMSKDINDHLEFIFADVLTQEEIIIELQRHLTGTPCDLVIIDSFGDIFKGTDLNSNAQMRSTVRDFDRIAKKFGCLILFVHHTNKSSYNQVPAQQHIQGGAGLTQKVRSALYLSPGVGNLKYLTIAKGNYCPKQYKDNATELIFDEEFFIFTASGKTVPIEKLSSERNVKEEEKLQTLINIAEIAFNGRPKMRYSELVKCIEEIKGKGVATAKRIIQQLRQFNILISDKQNNLCLQPPGDENTDKDPT
jgi:hypothetical protein